MSVKHVFFSLCVLLLSACARHSASNSRQYEPLPSDHPLRLAVTSCTHVGFMNELGMLDKVVAVCNRDLIYTPLPDSVIDLGDAISPSVEQLLAAHVDAVFCSTYAQNEFAQRAEQLGIRVIYIDEWRSETPLERAAWIKDFGQLLSCSERADSIYQAVEKKYNALADSVAKRVGKRPKLLTGSNFRGTWYVPAGNTFMGHFFADAGADYPYQNDTRGESIPLNVEEIVSTFIDADVWVGSNARSINELAQLDEKHTWLQPYKSGNVYNWLKQSTPSGANNFWERGVAHPEEVLEDLIRILHPLPQDTSFYYALRLE